MKKYLYSITVFAIVLVSIANVNFASRSNDLSDASLTNVEALASESGGVQPMDCWSNVSYTGDGRPVTDVTYCGDCQPIACTHWWNQVRCSR